MPNALDAVVDVMRVPAVGDPSAAVVAVDARARPRDIECEVLVVGGGTGGVAAALAVARHGRTVCLTEETDWIGGQLTAQGVSALDEHDHIETFGGTASYYRLRNALRDHYRPLASQNGDRADFNPGMCWVTRVAFEPRVAVASLTKMLRPHIESGALRLHLRTKPAAVAMDGDRIASVLMVDLDIGATTRFHPQIVIDATELGDLLPLANAEHVIGAETVADTGEPHAQPVEHKPRCVQSFTYTFGLERRPEGERHVVPQPERYDYFRKSQPYSLTIEVHGGEIYGEESGWLSYRVLETMPGTKGALWTYRRLVDCGQFEGRYPTDLTLINWPGNDYREATLLQGTAHDLAATLQDAKRASLGFLHWLQTEAPATAGRNGAPELKLRPDIMASADGLSKFPYIREARRIRAVHTIREQDVSAAYRPGARAAHFDDSIGVGWYPIDIHRAGPEDVGVSCRTRPFQISLGSLIPVRVENLLAASKNTGTTHITNGCYRLHPVEWNIGEAAGVLAAFALEHGRGPRSIHADAPLRQALQDVLLHDGVPLAWLTDIGVDHPAFAATQRLFMQIPAARPAGLAFEPKARLSPDAWAAWGGRGDCPPDRAEAALRLFADPR
jgi:hypothetical protein